MSEEYGLKFVVNGEDYDKIKKSLNEQIEDLQQKVEQLEKENFNIRENIHLERISLPPELTKDKNFMELYDIPSYEDLQQKVEQLENIRKEIKEYIEKNVVCFKNGDMLVELNVDDLSNILNEGDNNVKDKR